MQNKGSGHSWHSMSAEEALKLLETSPKGLTEAQAKERLLTYGPNELEEAKKISPFKIYVEQFKEPLIIILLVATLISALIGEAIDAMVILAIVVAATTLGFVQEYRAERSMELLKRMAAPTALVIRNEKEGIISARELVPGDVILVKSGDKVPADARIIEGFNLKVDEAPLTGESTPVTKKITIFPPDTPLADRLNILFSGTTVNYGRGNAVVVGTGMATEFGKIAGMMQTVEEKKTPLEIRMQEVGNWLIKLLLSIVAIIAVLGLIRGHGLIEMFLWGVSLAVAAVPEALPVIVTGGLAIGVHRMVKRRAIVRKLPAVETLGSTTIICSDKTGTLTKGEMTVRRLYLNDGFAEVAGVGYEPKGDLRFGKEIDKEEIKLLARVSALCNDARLEGSDGNWQIVGDPTEGALIVLAAKVGLSQEELKAHYPRVGEVPFTSERKRMSTVHSTPDGHQLVCVKGAPEVVLEKCTHIRRNGKIMELTHNDLNRILQLNEKMASEGLRILGIAYRVATKPFADYAEDDVERELIFLGLAGMIDPAREEAISAVELCRQAGIKVVMITGDHKLTAMAVAKELGLLNPEASALTGSELDRLSEEEFEKIVGDTVVYARTSPEHKTRIVKALKKKGHVVAMTGDGINDAPALKNSDIGVAMGITGTDVTKEASNMVLADDNFATIVAAIQEGRSIYSNIKKYLTFLLSCNIGELVIMAFAGLVALPLPLLAKQILYVNLATDGLPAMALGIDPPDKYVMKKSPRSPKEGVFKGLRGWLMGIAILISIVSLATFYYGLSMAGLGEEGVVRARSMIFATLIIFELGFVLSCRSFEYPLFKIGFFTNKYLIMALVWEAFLLTLLFNVPFLSTVFGIGPLAPTEWMMVIGFGLSGFILSEVVKSTRYFMRS